MWQRLGWVVAAVAAAFVVTGAGQYRPVTTGPGDAEAAAAVTALTGEGRAAPDGGLSAMPADFAEVMGYAPELVTDSDGTRYLVKPAGNCSSPFGATAYDFDRACKSHDLGYDLLRYATRSGAELGPWARRDVDAMLADDVRARCASLDGDGDGDGDGDPGCRVVAGLTSAVVEANSWRQGDGNPGSEESGPYLVAGALLAAAVVVPPVVARGRNRGRATLSASGPPSSRSTMARPARPARAARAVSR
ncbi:MAG TPA: hypothetical protein VIP77_10695 [Jiangellaceae bacterium]